MEPSDEPTGTPSAWSAGCPTCRRLRLDGPGEHSYAVCPADGGGWQVWSAALLRLLQRVGHQPTRAIIVSQPLLNDRYVQALIGHGIAHVEAGSNVYLIGESRLSADHEKLLARLGWSAPGSDADRPDEMPANWRLPLIHGDWPLLVEMLVSTMVVLGFVEYLPVEVRGFGADNPCRACSWPDENAGQEP